MKNKGTQKITILIVAALMLTAVGTVFADVNPNSQEFANFAEAITGVQEVQETVNARIDTIISQTPMGEERFLEVYQEVQATGNVPETLDQREVMVYQEAMNEINDVQMSSQEEMIAIVEQADLSVQRFNEIVMALQQDPSLQQALAELQ